MVYQLIPGVGTGTYKRGANLIMRFVQRGCIDRPTYLLVIQEKLFERYEPFVEQIGSYDPMINAYGERIAALNMHRIRYWIGNGVETADPVKKLLGIAGIFPVHYETYIDAWRNRIPQLKEAEEARNKFEKDAFEAQKANSFDYVNQKIKQ